MDEIGARAGRPYVKSATVDRPGHRPLPPARRHGRLRRDGAPGAGLLAQRAARRRAGQLRLRRPEGVLRPAGRLPVLPDRRRPRAPGLGRHAPHRRPRAGRRAEQRHAGRPARARRRRRAGGRSRPVPLGRAPHPAAADARGLRGHGHRQPPAAGAGAGRRRAAGARNGARWPSCGRARAWPSPRAVVDERRDPAAEALGALLGAAVAGGHVVAGARGCPRPPGASGPPASAPSCGRSTSATGASGRTRAGCGRARAPARARRPGTCSCC